MSLAAPIGLAGRTAQSRVIFGPHETNLGRARALSERHVAYYEWRARGGAGIVVTETASVHESDWPYERAPLAAVCGPGWRAVVDVCAPFGTLVLAGLGHTGGQGSSSWSQSALWAPSRVADPGTRELPMEMERREIDELVQGFSEAARRAVASGVDGVEVDAGVRSLLRQFQSGLTNTRVDDYGADRTRLTVEVLRAVRRELGPDRVLALRLSCDELAPWAGITPEQAAGQATLFAEWLDLLVVTRGGPFSVAAYRPDGHVEPGFNEDLARSIRAALAGAAAVVAVQGSIVDPGQAERMLDAGAADMVEMTRAQIADPELVAKVARGATGEIRPCVLCNQTCQVRDVRNPIVTCIAEPRSGHETTDPRVDGRHGPTPVVRVVGSGPAGLEAARVAALAGARVRVSERAPLPGGMLATIAQAPGRSRFGLLREWLVSECARLGVVIETGEVGPDALDVASRDGEKVVLATGGLAAPGPYVHRPDAVVVEPEVILRGPEPRGSLPDGPVVVLDRIGGPVGVAVAEVLAGAGRQVTFVTPDTVVGTLLSGSGDLVAANVRLEQAGVLRMTSTLLREVGAGSALLEDRWDGSVREIPCAVLVDCGPRVPNDELYALRPGTVRAGDCVAPRSVHEAILEGRRVAQAIVGGGGRPASFAETSRSPARAAR